MRRLSDVALGEEVSLWTRHLRPRNVSLEMSPEVSPEMSPKLVGNATERQWFCAQFFRKTHQGSRWGSVRLQHQTTRSVQ